VSDATRLVSTAAGEAVQDIVERYDGYHAHLVTKFVDVLRIQHTEPGDRARRRAIESLIEAFSGEVAANIGEGQ